MAHYTTTLTTQKPPEEVFDYLADFTHATEWDSNVTHAEQTSEGTIGEGTEFRLDYVVFRSHRQLVYRIADFTRPREVVLRCETPSMSICDRITVVSDGAGSRLTYAAEVGLKPPLTLFGPLFQRGFARAGDRARAGLARELEAS